MDFMEMREALSVAGCVAANGNEERFYGARPRTANRAMARAASIETAAPTARIGYDPRNAHAGKREPS